MNLSDTDWVLVRKAVQTVIDTTLSQSEHDALKGVMARLEKTPQQYDEMHERLWRTLADQPMVISVSLEHDEHSGLTWTKCALCGND